MKEQLFINNIEVELIKSLDPNLTFSINDISQPDKRKSNFSKTITLPGSKTINELFEYIFNINIDLQTFNPNVKTDCLYLVDGEIQLEGYLQLKKINILDRNNITYNVVIFGEIGNFISLLGNDRLTDLDFSSLNHVYNSTNQSATWNLPLTTDYVYPMIEYGVDTENEYWSDTKFFPAIKVKKYIDLIMDSVGFTYDSLFFNNVFFNTLIIPFSDKLFCLSETEVDSRRFRANTPTIGSSLGTELSFDGLTDMTLNTGPENLSKRVIKFGTEVYDNSNQYDPLTGTFVVNNSGYYNLETSFDLQYEFTTPAYGFPNIYQYAQLYGFFSFEKFDSLGVSLGIIEQAWIALGKQQTQLIQPSTTYISANPDTYPSNSFPDSGTAPYLSSGYYWTYGLNDGNHEGNPPNRFNCLANNVFLDSGEQVKVVLQVGLYGVPHFPIGTTTLIKGTYGVAPTGGLPNIEGGDFTFRILNGYFKNEVVNSGYTSGNTISMNDAVPTKIKQRDFFMSIVKMFNLFVEVDNDDRKKLLIEPREDFYNNSVNDWQKKLDNSQELNFLPMGALDSKEYLYTYKKDKDYYNKMYEETWQEVYGQREYIINNDFVKKEFKTEIVFSPTPSVSQDTTDRVLPTIFNYSDNNGVQRVDANIRILQWGGLKSTQQTWFHFVDTGNIPIGTAPIGAIAKSDYPYSGHYDDPYTPSIDINFGVTKEIYYANNFGLTITFTNNNLFNKYHKKFIEEITDINSKIVKGYFYLTPTDIKNLSFQELYFFENQYFRLYKVENYNPINPITKCEFLLIQENDVFEPDTVIGNGGNDNNIGDEFTALFSNGVEKTINNNVVRHTQEVLGVNNYVSKFADNIEILGNGNKVFSDTRNIAVSGSNNIIKSGVSDVILINTNDVEVISSNVTYINGALQGSGSVVTITSSTTADESISTYLADTNVGNILISLPTDVNVGKIWNVKLIDNTNTCQLRCVGRLIDGNVTETITRINTCISVQYDGLNYNII